MGLQGNDTIAVIVILLIVILALISFGIYRLVAMVRRDMSSASGSSPSGSDSLVDD